MMNPFEWASCVAMGMAVFSAGWMFLGIVLMPRVNLGDLTQQNSQRIQTLRENSHLYRLFETVLPQLASVRLLRTLTRSDILKKHIASGASDLPFTVDEMVGWVFIRGLAIAFASGAMLCLIGMTGCGLIVGILMACFYPCWFARWDNQKTNERWNQISKRLAHATDLLAMQLNAGASFRNSFSLITKELAGHPLGNEFQRVIRDTEQGMSLRESLNQLQTRIPTNDVRDFVGAIQSSQRRGTPLAKTLNNLAEQMRRYRTERAERAAGEAQANITFPGLIMMGACLLVLLAPFVLQLIEENPFDF